MPPTDVKELLTNQRLYLEQLVKISDKDKRRVPFALNNSQDRLWEYITPGGRLVALKARQIGSTSVFLGKFLADCLTRPGTTSVIASENEFSTQRLLTRARFMYDSIPDNMKPEIQRKSAYELTWPEINSAMFITTARANLLVRGDTVHNFLATEIARWPDAEGALADVEEAVPLTGFIVMESTPMGEDDYFYNRCQTAQDGTDAYKFLFLPWYDHVEYQIPKGSILALEKDRGDLEYTPEEQKVVDAYGLSEAQIRWRRRKIADRKLDFFQEYPEDPISCFQKSGSLVFDSDRLNELAINCYEPPFTFGEKGETRIWFPPKEGGFYQIAVDPTAGQHDRAAATVWNIVGPTHVASLWGLYEPEKLAQLLFPLGKHYNNAQIMVESNGPGLAVLSTLYYHLKYNNLGYMPDLVTNTPTPHLGWQTTKGSKPYMIATMQREIMNLITWDIHLLRQLRNLRKVGLDVISVGEDDLAMSAMIATASYRSIIAGSLGFQGSYGWEW